MSNRRIAFITTALFFGTLCQNAMATSDSVYVATYDEQVLQPLSPTYLDNTVAGSSLAANWFISVKGGASAFIGKPIGCEDLFGRTQPLFSASIGKWFSPHYGARASFQGFKFIDSNIRNCEFQSVHMDLLYNICNGYRYSEKGIGKWGVIPFLGVGIINNAAAKKNPFALSYGIDVQYGISNRLVISAELAATTTHQDFDGVGDARNLGDHLLQASIGLTLNIGKTGWKRIIDPMPYVYQNDWLIQHTEQLMNQLNRQKAEMEANETERMPKNDYSGLNSLRTRMGQKEEVVVPASTGVAATASMPPTESIGAPVNFFFKLGTDELTSLSQMLNIIEIANVAKKQNYRIEIIGAADEATGTEEGNRELSIRRANHISSLLQKHGVEADRITCLHEGGVSKYKPVEINRYTKVKLFAH